MIRIEVAVALPREQELIELELEEGATVGDALREARLSEQFPSLAIDDVGIWSRPVDKAQRLRDGDRVEIYRPLILDPMEQRRRRLAGQTD